MPFVIIECAESVQEHGKQTFMAAALVCLFIVEGEKLPFGVDHIHWKDKRGKNCDTIWAMVNVTFCNINTL